mgnify:CR=1 FL=1|jgi:hypothetical protein
MGIITNIVAYKLGKRSGKRDSDVVVVNDRRNPECLNYESYCKNYGSCNGQECDYEDD